jgi:hypothetical protein
MSLVTLPDSNGRTISITERNRRTQMSSKKHQASRKTFCCANVMSPHIDYLRHRQNEDGSCQLISRHNPINCFIFSKLKHIDRRSRWFRSIFDCIFTTPLSTMADPSQKFRIKPILQINDESWRKFKINDYLGRGRGGGGVV